MGKNILNKNILPIYRNGQPLAHSQKWAELFAHLQKWAAACLFTEMGKYFCPFL